MKNALRTDAQTIFADSLQSCSVRRAFGLKMESRRTGDRCALHLQGLGEIDLTGIALILVIAVGKAASTMLDAFLDVCPVPPGCLVQGVVIAPSASAQPRPGFAYFQGGHPFPNQSSFDGANAALALLESAAHHDGRAFCFFLISGGGSAMMELPLDRSISLEDAAGFHRALVGSGASIAEINCVRKHFSAVKGGRLAQAAGQVNHLSLLLSDVPAGHLDALSSGPTLADPTTVRQCRSILEKYDLVGQFPLSVQRYFQSPALLETPKPGDFAEKVFVLLSSDDLAEAARRRADELGYVTVIDNTCDDWDYREAVDYLLQRVRSLQQDHSRVCIISAGEVTVQMAEQPHGIGGRNTHFALYGAIQLHPDESITILSGGSDGVDGNSPAAGAVTDAATVLGRGLEAKESLQAFDSFTFLEGAVATLMTGPTGNNLRDLRIFLSQKASPEGEEGSNRLR